VIKQRSACVEAVLELWMKVRLTHKADWQRVIHRWVPGLLPHLWTTCFTYSNHADKRSWWASWRSSEERV